MWCKLTTNVDLTIKNEYQIQLQFDTHLGLHFHFLYSKTELLNRKHLAFLIAITLLKQVLTIPEVKNGILFQGKVSGIREAYDLFCTEQELAIHYIASQATQQSLPTNNQNEIELLAVRVATRSFANKLLAEKTIELQTNLYLTGEDSYE